MKTLSSKTTYLKFILLSLTFMVTVIHNACSPLKTDIVSGLDQQALSDDEEQAPVPNPIGFVGAAELPRLYVNTTMPVQTGQIINVAANGDFQAALNTAQPGDTVVLAAGATYTGNFILPAKTNPQNKWIIITTSLKAQLPGEGKRVSPSHASAMPKIISPNVEQVIVAAQASSHYRFIGVEVTDHGASSPYGPALPGGGRGGYNQGLIDLGQIGRDTQISQLPHHIIFDRCFIHGQKNSHIKYGVSMEGAYQAVIDSYLSDFHGVGQDTQAIRSLNGSGPFKIVNNFLEGAGENVMFGGADPSIYGMVPSDIEFKNNHLFKPLSWKIGHATYAGIPWTVKNLFETKNAQRLLMEGNILENCWAHGQTGFGFVLKSANQDGKCSWCVSQDLVIRYNHMINTDNGVSLSTLDEYSGGGGIPQRRVRVEHNLFENVGHRLFQIVGGSNQGPQRNLEIVHNTAFQVNPTGDYAGIVIGDTAPVVNGLTIKDNIFVPSQETNAVSIMGSGQGSGLSALNFYMQNHSVQGNVFVTPGDGINSIPNNLYTSRTTAAFVDYQSGNFELTSNSPLKNTASDGTDPGAHISLVKSKTARTRTGN